MEINGLRGVVMWMVIAEKENGKRIAWPNNTREKLYCESSTSTT